MTKILINFLAIIFISEVSVYLIGIFFIVYVILGRVYRSRVKDYNYEINDFSSECSYYFDGLNYSSNIYYASNQEYEILSGRKPEDEYEFVLIYNNPTNNEIRRYASDIGSYLEIKLNNGTGSEKFKLVGIGEYNSKLSNQTFATDCERLQQLLTDHSCASLLFST